MQLSRLRVFAGLLLAALMAAPLWGANTPLPGTVNYVEGQASLGGQALSSKSIGSVELRPGESLSTENGMAEILLTPGVFLRLGDNSSVRMVSPRLTNTEVNLSRGRALVEADQLYKANDVRVTVGNATTRLLKTGLYGFDADRGEVRVFSGQAWVLEGERQVKVNPAGKLKAAKFDKRSYEGDLYRFSKLRSDYLAQANAQAARVYVNYGWWPGAGWWWNPWFGGYTFIPAAGVFYSPFGWSFYSPIVLGGRPYWGGRPYYYGPPHFGYYPGVRVPPGSPGFPHGPAMGAFHGPAGFHGGAIMR